MTTLDLPGDAIQQTPSSSATFGESMMQVLDSNNTLAQSITRAKNQNKEKNNERTQIISEPCCPPIPLPAHTHTHTSRWVQPPHSSFCIPVTSICCNDRKSSSHNERKARRKTPKGEATTETQPCVVMLEDAAGPERYIKVFQGKSHDPLSIMRSYDRMIQHVTKLTSSSMLCLVFML